MLHACVQRFDVTRNLEKIYKILGTKQALSTNLADFLIMDKVHDSGIRSIRDYNFVYCFLGGIYFGPGWRLRRINRRIGRQTEVPKIFS
jgi:hypothetical protein